RDSPVRRATLVFYTNFSPSLARLPFFPIADWGLDFETDYAVAYDGHERALLHFLPASAASYPHDFSLVNPLLRSPPARREALRRAVDRLVAGLGAPGVYLAAGARPADGKLARSPIAACQANAALARRLAFRLGTATATFYVAAGGTRDEAYALLRGARARGTSPAAQRAATEAWWASFLAPAHLPDTDD